MNFQNIKIWRVNLDEYTINEMEIPENAFNKKKELQHNDLYLVYGCIYFQLTEESAKNSLRKYIRDSIAKKKREIETLKNHLFI